jgi:hypothetical protein
MRKFLCMLTGFGLAVLSLDMSTRLALADYDDNNYYALVNNFNCTQKTQPDCNGSCPDNYVCNPDSNSTTACICVAAHG